jgi:hypothetical protein
VEISKVFLRFLIRRINVSARSRVRKRHGIYTTRRNVPALAFGDARWEAIDVATSFAFVNFAWFSAIDPSLQRFYGCYLMQDPRSLLHIQYKYMDFIYILCSQALHASLFLPLQLLSAPCSTKHFGKRPNVWLFFHAFRPGDDFFRKVPIEHIGSLLHEFACHIIPSHRIDGITLGM